MKRRHQGHEPMHPRGTCRSCSMRRTMIVRAVGMGHVGRPRKEDHRPGYDRPVMVRWSAIEENIVRAFAGVITVGKICAQILERSGHVRTPNAIRLRAHLLGVPLYQPGYSIGEVAHLMGVDHRTAQRWIKRGLMGPPNEPHRVARVSQEDLDTFVRDRTDLYDRLGIQSARLRGIANSAWTREPWLDTHQIALLLCRHPRYVNVLFWKGALSGVKRPKWGAHHGGVRWIAKRSEVIRFITENTHLIGHAPYGHQEAI